MQNFSPQSKVWVYQSSRPFTESEIVELNNKLKHFTVQWTAHNKQLLASGNVMYDRFIVLMVDESHTMASGCSIDTSVHFIKQLEQDYTIDLFNRTIVNMEINGIIQTISLDELSTKFKSGEINASKMVFDPLVQQKRDFDKGFKIPLAESWMMNLI
ncbi:MAG TPA: hypothetical protein PLB46_11405 [Chitinophagales bacterium]|nr:hypothetical protein [Chitinophagales bacterium]